jgi:hypothetical protein
MENITMKENKAGKTIDVNAVINQLERKETTMINGNVKTFPQWRVENGRRLADIVREIEQEPSPWWKYQLASKAMHMINGFRVVQTTREVNYYFSQVMRDNFEAAFFFCPLSTPCQDKHNDR